MCPFLLTLSVFEPEKRTQQLRDVFTQDATTVLEPVKIQDLMQHFRFFYAFKIKLKQSQTRWAVFADVN